jgi:hypothetical protein
MEKISVGKSREGYMGNNPEEFPNADVCNLEIVHLVITDSSVL